MGSKVERFLLSALEATFVTWLGFLIGNRNSFALGSKRDSHHVEDIANSESFRPLSFRCQLMSVPIDIQDKQYYCLRFLLSGSRLSYMGRISDRKSQLAAIGPKRDSHQVTGEIQNESLLATPICNVRVYCRCPWPC